MCKSLYPTSLKKSHIRLLEILPSEGSTQLPLQCQLRQYDLDTVPKYEALSYCWGDATERCNLSCNGRSVSVTESLYSALLRLRREDQSRVIWADALCINQEDNEEKGNQVSLMGQIYAHGVQTIVWLGSPEDHCEEQSGQSVGDNVSSLPDALDRIHEAFQASRIEPDNTKLSQAEWHKMRLPAEQCALLSATLPWTVIAALFSLPWFQRIWCVQETRLARITTFYWGSTKLEGQKVELLIQYCYLESDHTGTSIPIGVPWHHAMAMFAPLQPERNEQCALLQHLSVYRMFLATDPRDKVFGLLGLRELEEESNAISVDYTKSVADVYSEVAQAIIKLTCNCSILDFVTHPEDYDGGLEYASWVPRWDRKWMMQHVGASDVDLTKLPQQYIHSICASPTQLKLEGFLYDTIDSKSFTMEGLFMYFWRSERSTELVASVGHPILQYWLATVSHSAVPALEEMPAAVRMARTLTAGRTTIAGHKYTDSDAEQLDLYLDSFFDYINLLFGLAQSDVEEISEERLYELYGTRWQLFAEIASTPCQLRCIFRTANGTFGIGPGCLRESDLIVQFFGRGIPYALRKKGAEYILIGRLYIEGPDLNAEFEDGRVAKENYSLI
ncbi:hypothetical protein ACN47E_003372 [Coniothyrium glycines]